MPQHAYKDIEIQVCPCKINMQELGKMKIYEFKYYFSLLIPTFCEDIVIVQELFGLNIERTDYNSSPLKYIREEIKRNKKLK